MKEKEARGFLFLLFIIIKGFNETRKSRQKIQTAYGNNGLLDFKKYFKINVSFAYSSHQCHVFHNIFPSDAGTDTVTVKVKVIIITELIRSQNSMAFIFLLAETQDYVSTFFIIRRLLSERDQFENHSFILNTLPMFSSQSPNSLTLYLPVESVRNSF